MGAAGAVLLTGGGAAAWVTAARGGGTGAAPRALPAYRIALHADLTGPGKAVGLAHQRGALLAVDDHNARKDKAFTLVLHTEDDAGDAARASRVADRITADPRMLAVIGPTGPVATEAVVSRYAKAGLAQVVVAAGSTTAETSTAKSLFVLRPFDVSLALGVTRHLAYIEPVEHVAVIEDLADPEGSWAIRDRLPKTLKGTTITVHTVAATARTFAPAARARSPTEPARSSTPARPPPGPPAAPRTSPPPASPEPACPPAPSSPRPSSGTPAGPPRAGSSPRRTPTRRPWRRRRPSPRHTANGSARRPPPGPPRRTTRWA